jgi:hypothetical protein
MRCRARRRRGRSRSLAGAAGRSRRTIHSSGATNSPRFIELGHLIGKRFEMLERAEEFDQGVEIAAPLRRFRNA